MRRLLAAALVVLLSAALHAPADAGQGSFTGHTYTTAAGTLTYKVYVPPGPRAPRDLVVVLHGAGETADVAATRSRWNDVARRHRFVVAYPEQNPAYDDARTWDWATAGKEGRSNREASLVAGITRTVTARHRLDPRRVFVMGISAGAGMTGAMVTAYPELYAAFGHEAGCPFDNVACGGSSVTPEQSAAAAVEAMGGRGRPLPVFNEYGTADPIAAAVRSDEVVPSWLTVADLLDDGADDGSVSRTPYASRVETPTPPAKPYRVSAFRDARGCPLAEDWVVVGGTHAWAGGRPTGADDVVADPLGPDVTTAMYRFFDRAAAAGCR